MGHVRSTREGESWMQSASSGRREGRGGLMSTHVVLRARVAVVMTTVALCVPALAPAASIALPSKGGGGVALPAQTHA